ncbi:hypothetical protein CC1G_14327 [Coprinopsis cinerea okayama7|uniref:Uncharacterized protein n=1 Tax=Coprinopsis cinerea (strain Okayama-7 / 130 / ATCC MYA-4618 / FGSC 9003) TaxID=240176 RepID=D6RM63_COPC7|nr:hypothetical protein CC1G_14327 [Coprinopsis cinerea okayama7\|eukprot:XP_002911332.1 hypothetical protein CC1G_14327 [Coprinopsis cinerea okayama7\
MVQSELALFAYAFLDWPLRHLSVFEGRRVELPPRFGRSGRGTRGGGGNGSGGSGNTARSGNAMGLGYRDTNTTSGRRMGNRTNGADVVEYSTVSSWKESAIMQEVARVVGSVETFKGCRIRDV